MPEIPYIKKKLTYWAHTVLIKPKQNVYNLIVEQQLR